jgi:hypothetical protein
MQEKCPEDDPGYPAGRISMRLSGRTIAILFHENESLSRLERFAITFLADFWREDGNDVVFLLGTDRYVPADILVVHVDLSVVPGPYLDFAARYPIALNRRAADIRKSIVSGNLVRPDDGYDGPVIVKSDQNYAGGPERLLAPRRARWLPRIPRRRPARVGFRTSLDYRIYATVADVPRADFEQTDRIVERFLPEREGGLYFVRAYQFLGDRASCMRLASPNPIVNDETTTGMEEIEPDPEIVRARERLGFDYGKLDYVVRGGSAILLDANKTTGASRIATPELVAQRRHRADGIYSYLA